MLKIIFAVLTGLVGAGLLHLIIILAIPHFSDRDTYNRAIALGAEHRFHLIDGENADTDIVNEDPAMRVAVCHLDITENPVHITGFGVVPFWSISVYDSASNEIFSMNDRTSVRGALDVLIATPTHAAALQKEQNPALAQAITVETNRENGYAILRTLIPQPSFIDEAERFLTTSLCQPFIWQSAKTE